MPLQLFNEAITLLRSYRYFNKFIYLLKSYQCFEAVCAFNVSFLNFVGTIYKAKCLDFDFVLKPIVAVLKHNFKTVFVLHIKKARNSEPFFFITKPLFLRSFRRFFRIFIRDFGRSFDGFLSRNFF